MRQQTFWKKVLLFVLFSFTFLVFLVGGAVYAFISKIQTPVSNEVPVIHNTTTSRENIPGDALNQSTNILLIGLDDGDPDNPNSPRRSDVMMVASIDAENKKINLLSIPRDSRVAIPNHDGYDKINNAYFYGGPKLAMRTVKDFLHIPLHYYIAIEWQSFIKIVDILGGVELNVEHDMNYEDPYENLKIHLSKGNQHLDGKKAGEYVRFRHDELGDIGRVERQQHFLTALNNQMLQSGTILKLPSLITTISKYVRTDIDISTFIKIANTLRAMKTGSLHTQMVPGDFATIDDISYWLPDMDKTQSLVKRVFSSTTN